MLTPFLSDLDELRDKRQRVSVCDRPERPLWKPVKRDDSAYDTIVDRPTYKEKNEQYKIANTINPENEKSNSRNESLNKKILTNGKKIEMTKHG